LGLAAAGGSLDKDPPIGQRFGRWHMISQQGCTGGMKTPDYGRLQWLYGARQPPEDYHCEAVSLTGVQLPDFFPMRNRATPTAAAALTRQKEKGIPSRRGGLRPVLCHR
jgi:hypothetical protein